MEVQVQVMAMVMGMGIAILKVLPLSQKKCIIGIENQWGQILNASKLSHNPLIMK